MIKTVFNREDRIKPFLRPFVKFIKIIKGTSDSTPTRPVHATANLLLPPNITWGAQLTLQV